MSKKLCLLCSIILIFALFTGCGLSASSKLAGQWERENVDIFAEFDELEFFSDGKYSSDDINYSGNYSIEGDRIRMTGILVETLTFTFKISGNQLTLINDDGDEWIYKKLD